MRPQYQHRVCAARTSIEKCLADHGEIPQYRQWYVYFVTQPHSGLIKIGVSSSLNQRIQSISSASGFVTELVAYWPYERRDAFAVEAYLHRLFDANRAIGEWFEGIEIPSIPLDAEWVKTEQAA